MSALDSVADFSDATFPADIDFSGFTFKSEVRFFNTTFGGKANFRGATFNGQAYFSEAAFHRDADFNNTVFKSAAVFLSVPFSAEAIFNEATFNSTASFDRATFARTEFHRTRFSAAASFTRATFKAPTFFFDTIFEAGAYFGARGAALFEEDVYFGGASFIAQAAFRSVAFRKKASFQNVTFLEDAKFSRALFDEKADFWNATFGGNADFIHATFNGLADFNHAKFRNEVKFEGNDQTGFRPKSSLNLQSASMDRPERVSFRSLGLRPHWFVNVDSRKFNFANVTWSGSVSEELRELNGLLTPSIQALFEIACLNLAMNAEESHFYEDASRFRYQAMEARRRKHWRVAPWRLSWWYWLASGYGERVSQAFLALLSIWLLAGLLYTFVGFARWEPKLASESDVVIAKRDEVGAPLNFGRALTYSVGVMMLQKPEPRPATTAAQAVVLLETILGPVQAALLALAIRRKFMR
jgi:hypothetical protein